MDIDQILDVATMHFLLAIALSTVRTPGAYLYSLVCIIRPGAYRQ